MYLSYLIQVVLSSSGFESTNHMNCTLIYSVVKIMLGLFLLFIYSSSSGQMISIIKAGTKQRRIYHVGEHIELKYEKKMLKGELFYISDSTLIVEDKIIPTTSIRLVRDSPSGNFQNRLGKKLVATGIFYFCITTINRTGNGNYPLFVKDNLSVSLGFIFTGLVLRKLNTHIYRINNKCKLTVLSPI